MGLIDIMGVLVALAAGLAFINHKLLRLPTTVGLMLLALINAGLVLLVGRFYPPAIDAAQHLIGSIDFNTSLMQGMLGYLLFAGALHVNLNDLRQQKLVIALLATVGVLITTVLVGGFAYGITQLLGIEVRLLHCLIFGSLIAPTDPIAVLSIVKKLGAPKSLETKIAGESLFNDGVGVVVFIALMGVAGLGGGHEEVDTPTSSEHYEQVLADIQKQYGMGSSPLANHSELDEALGHKDPHAESANNVEDEPTALSIAADFAHEAGGGILFGLALGLVAFFLIRSIDHYTTEILLSLAIVTGGYALAYKLHVSGPLAMVVAGLLIGNHGRALAMSDKTREHLDTFWELVDELLNAVLFVLIGLEVLVLSLDGQYLLAGALAVPAALLARFMSVGGVVLTLRRFRGFSPHAVKVITWGGLRGGISIAMALSLKDALSGGNEADAAAGNALLTMAYVVVAFSILVGGLTVGPLLKRYGLAGHGAAGSH